jgi:hypothetical protein
VPFLLSGSGFDPDIVGLSNGGFLACWHGGGTDGNVFLRIYDAAGAPVGDDIVVNSILSGDQINSSVTVLENSNIVVSWGSEQQIGEDPEGYPIFDTDVRAQILSPDGIKIGTEIVIRSSGADEDDPRVTALAGGGFAIANLIEEYGSFETTADDILGIQTQVYAANGLPIGPSLFFDQGNDCELTGLADGSFVMVWNVSTYDEATDTETTLLFAQRISSSGSRVGDTIDLGETPEDFSFGVAGLSSGSFVITWTDPSMNVVARTFDASGLPEAPAFVVNSTLVGEQTGPSIAANGDEFLIVWDQNVGTHGILGQRFSATGERIDEEFVIVSGLDDNGTISLGVMPGGGFAIAWEDDDLSSLFAHFVPGGLTIEPLELQANGEDFELASDGLSATGEGTITIGRTDGIFPMLTANEATGDYTASTVSVSSDDFTANIGALAETLWSGSVEIDVATQRGTITDNGGNGQFELGVLPLEFNQVAIFDDHLAFEVTISLSKMLEGDVITSSLTTDQKLIFDQDGIRFAPEFSVPLPNASFNLFGTIPATITDIDLSYDGIENAVYLRSLIQLGIVVQNEIVTFEADFTGDNFIRYGPEGLDAIIDFDVDAGIEFAGWGLENMHVSLDTVANEVEAEATVTTPFGVSLTSDGVNITVGVGITYDPFELDSVSIEADNLDLALPSMPLYRLQSIGGELDNLAAGNEDPIEFTGSIGGTYGPEVAGSSIASLDIEGTISRDEMRGTVDFALLPVDFNAFGGAFTGSFSVLEATGSGSLNWTNGTFDANGNVSLIGGLFQASSRLHVDQNWNFSLGQQLAFAVPTWVPVYSGTVIATGNLAVQFTNNGVISDDYAMVWGSIHLQKQFPLGVKFTVDLTAGIRFGFDGSVELVGANDIPPSSLVTTSLTSLGTGLGGDIIGKTGADVPPAMVGAGEEYILLSAHWANVASSVELIITLPDGTVIHESEFAEHQIAIIDEFSTAQSRVAIAFSPDAGAWSVTAQSSSGTLEQLQTNVLEAAIAPSMTIDGIAVTSDSELSINFSAVDEDSGAEITFWYSTSPDPSIGTLIGSASEMDSAGSLSWDTAGLAAGQYYIFAVIGDGDSAPVTVQGGSKIIIADGQPPVVRPIDPANDFNGDGISDILWRSDSGQLSNWLGNDAGGFANNDANAFSNVPANWHVAGTGDFNGDGLTDVLWRSDTGQVSDWLGQANGGFVANDGNALASVPTNWQIAGTGDFNGDNVDDILWRSDDGALSNWLGTDNGGFTVNDINAFNQVPTNWHVAGTGDFNGDDIDDILWRSDDGQLSNWLGTKTGGFTNNDGNAFTSAPTDWHVAGTGDFNGDGFDDVLWRSDSGALSNWLGSESGGFLLNDANAFTQAPTSWQVVAVGDYNGDGFDDILWRSDTGQLSDWLGTETGAFENNDANAFANVPTNWTVQPVFDPLP